MLPQTILAIFSLGAWNHLAASPREVTVEELPINKETVERLIFRFTNDFHQFQASYSSQDRSCFVRSSTFQQSLAWLQLFLQNKQKEDHDLDWVGSWHLTDADDDEQKAIWRTIGQHVDISLLHRQGMTFKKAGHTHGIPLHIRRAHAFFTQAALKGCFQSQAELCMMNLDNHEPMGSVNHLLACKDVHLILSVANYAYHSGAFQDARQLYGAIKETNLAARYNAALLDFMHYTDGDPVDDLAQEFLSLGAIKGLDAWYCFIPCAAHLKGVQVFDNADTSMAGETEVDASFSVDESLDNGNSLSCPLDFEKWVKPETPLIWRNFQVMAAGQMPQSSLRASSHHLHLESFRETHGTQHRYALRASFTFNGESLTTSSSLKSAVWTKVYLETLFRVYNEAPASTIAALINVISAPKKGAPAYPELPFFLEIFKRVRAEKILYEEARLLRSPLITLLKPYSADVILRRMTEAASIDDPHACVEVALFYGHDLGSDASRTLAHKWLMKAILHPGLDAQWRLFANNWIRMLENHEAIPEARQAWLHQALAIKSFEEQEAIPLAWCVSRTEEDRTFEDESGDEGVYGPPVAAPPTSQESKETEEDKTMLLQSAMDDPDTDIAEPL